MNRKLTLKIKRRSQPGWLCWLLIVLPFLCGTLGFPGSLRYTMDAVWFALLVVMLVYRKSIAWRNLSGLILWVTGFLLFSACRTGGLLCGSERGKRGETGVIAPKNGNARCDH